MHMKKWQHPWHVKKHPSAICHLTVDGDLLVGNHALAEACLPLEAADQLRMRPSALLYASAVTVTCDLAPEPHRNAMMAAVKPLGFTREKFLARCPIQQELTHLGQRGYIVRDGKGQRAYFLGEPASLAACCDLIWDEQERPMTPADRKRIPAPALNQYGFAMAPVTEGHPGPLTYLGSMRVAAPLKDLAPLRSLAEVMPLCIAPPHSAPEHTQALCRLSSAGPSDNTLHVAAAPVAGDCFVAEQDHWVQQIREGLVRARREKRAGITLAIGGALLAAGTILLLLGLFLYAAVPDMAAKGMALLGAATLCGIAGVRHPRWWMAALAAAAGTWLLLGLPLVPGLFCVAGGALCALAVTCILNRLFTNFR